MVAINRILCSVDFPPFSDRALAYAMKVVAGAATRAHPGGGSSSKDVIRQAHCPVLVVPTPRQRAAVRAAS